MNNKYFFTALKMPFYFSYYYLLSTIITNMVLKMGVSFFLNTPLSSRYHLQKNHILYQEINMKMTTTHDDKSRFNSDNNHTSKNNVSTNYNGNSNIKINMDGAGRKRVSNFGLKSYWDAMYEGIGDRPSNSYSWYCDWNDLAPFWNDLIPQKDARVLIAGIGNDVTPIGLYDAGWANMIAYDYSEAAILRANELFGAHRKKNVELFVANACNLRPIADSSVDAVLDKGLLDTISFTGKDALRDSVRELSRVTAEGGILVCLSRVIDQEELLKSFEARLWDVIRDGSLSFASDGQATIDLSAGLYSWRRTSSPLLV